MPEHDVAIVGAGPVGLLLGCLLAQAGIDVAIYERRASADSRSRAIGIHPPGQDALAAAGLGEQVVAEALVLDGGEVICAGRTLASLSFTPHQRVLILPQHRTHALLTGRLAQLPNAVLHVSHEVWGVQDEGGVVRLAVDADGAQREVTASFVVAADGVRSGIRQQLGIGWRRQPGAGSYAMVDIPGVQTSSRVQLHCEPGGLVESFPLVDGKRWVAADPQGALGGAAAFVRAVAERTGVHLELPVGLQPTVFQASQHRAARMTVGRVALIGDAAHETSPIGGQGMNLGWAAAQHLAVALELSVRSRQAELQQYEQRTQGAAARAQRRSRFYMAMGHSAHGPKLLARSTAIRLLSTAPLRGHTANMITMRGW